jgi:hypothetical protein
MLESSCHKGGVIAGFDASEAWDMLGVAAQYYEALNQHKVVRQLVVLPVAFIQPHCVLLLVLLLLLLLFVSPGR